MSNFHLNFFNIIRPALGNPRVPTGATHEGVAALWEKKLNGYKPEHLKAAAEWYLDLGRWPESPKDVTAWMDERSFYPHVPNALPAPDFEHSKKRADLVKEYLDSFRDKIRQITTVTDSIASGNMAADLTSSFRQWLYYGFANSKTSGDIDPQYLEFHRFLGWIRDDVKAKCIFYRREQPAWVDSTEVMPFYIRDSRHDQFIANNIQKVIKPTKTHPQPEWLAA